MATESELLLVNLGSPEEPSPNAVREFLAEFLSDPMVIDYPRWLWQPILRGAVLRRRPQAVAELYRSIWRDEGSPLRQETERMAAGLSRILDGRCRVTTAYRYGQPSLARLVADAALRGVDALLVLPLFPQRSFTTEGSIEVVARASAARCGFENRLEMLQLPPDDESYIEALAGRVRNALSAGPEPGHLVVSFHGVPRRYDRKDRGLYRRDCQVTASRLLRRLDWSADRATLCYQSRFGPEPWLTPATDQVITALPAAGVRDVAVVAPGFVTDGLETLEELGVRGRESFLGHGGRRFNLVPAVADHPAFLRGLAARVDEALDRRSSSVSSRSDREPRAVPVADAALKPLLES